MSSLKSLEQRRASKAWVCIESVKGKTYAGDYASLVKSAPADIQVNGLGQTLAFWKAKGYDKGKPKNNGEQEHCKLLEQVSDWVCTQLSLNSQDLLIWIMQDASTDSYRRAAAEALAFLEWMKRFAEAELGGE